MTQFRSKNRLKVKPEDILDFEGETGLALPEDFKTQLRKFNGGMSEDQAYFKAEEEEYEFEFFYALLSDADYQNTLLKSFNNTQDFLPAQHLTFGAIVGGNLCMNLSDTENGSIYIYFSDVELVKVASNFTDFLNMLYED